MNLTPRTASVVDVARLHLLRPLWLEAPALWLENASRVTQVTHCERLFCVTQASGLAVFVIRNAEEEKRC